MGLLERISLFSVEQMINVSSPQILKDIVEVATLVPLERQVVRQDRFRSG